MLNSKWLIYPFPKSRGEGKLTRNSKQKLRIKTEQNRFEKNSAGESWKLKTKQDYRSSTYLHQKQLYGFQYKLSI